MQEVQPHTKAIARLRIAAWCLREAASKRGHDARSRALLITSAKGLFTFWLCYVVGPALVAARFTLDQLAGQVVELAASGDYEALLDAPSSVELRTATVIELRQIADMAARSRVSMHFEGLHVDPAAFVAALEAFSGDELCSFGSVEQAGARWLLVRSGDDALLILRETPPTETPEHERPTLPPSADASTAPPVPRTAPRLSPRLYTPALRAEGAR